MEKNNATENQWIKWNYVESFKQHLLVSTNNGKQKFTVWSAKHLTTKHPNTEDTQKR